MSFLKTHMGKIGLPGLILLALAVVLLFAAWACRVSKFAVVSDIGTLRTESFQRLPGRSRVQYTPALDDLGWDKYYEIIRRALISPLANLEYQDIDPFFGRFGHRIHPINGIVGYHHTGIDMYLPQGTAILAVGEGTIMYTGFDSGAGNWLKIRHEISGLEPFYLESFYYHLDEISPGLVRGVMVQSGQSLGGLGGTGVMQGCLPHLHFELRLLGPREIMLNPALVLFGRDLGLAANLTADLPSPEAGAGAGIRKQISLNPVYREYWNHFWDCIEQCQIVQVRHNTADILRRIAGERF